MKVGVLFILFLFGMVDVMPAQTLTKHDFLKPSYSVAFQNETPPLKNAALARTISITSTLASYYVMAVLVSNESRSVPAYLLATSFLITAPSAGYLYIQNGEEFWYGTGRRSLAMGAVILGGAFLALNNSLDSTQDLSNKEGDSDVLGASGALLILGGAAFFVWQSVVDIIDVRAETERYNRRQKRTTTLSPVIDPQNGIAAVKVRLNF